MSPQHNDSAAREIVITRAFDAPRELVFAAFTDPVHVAAWWGPRGFTTTIRQMDVRPGGIWRLVMHGPDGRDYHNRLEYLEVVAPERLVYRHAPDAECEQVHQEVTITLAESHGQTVVTLRMVFPTAQERDQVVKKYGAIEGGRQTFQKLAEHLAAQTRGGQADDPRFRREVVLTRLFDAPRKLVFRMWIEPEHLAAWWGPQGFCNPECRLDVRPGGSMWVLMRGPDGTEHPMKGMFHEIVPPERLVFTATAVDQQGRTLLSSHTVVTFADENGKTRLTVEAKAVGIADASAQMLGGMDQGWSQSLDRLAERVAAQ